MGRGAQQAYSPLGCKRVGHNLMTKEQQQCIGRKLKYQRLVPS